MADTRRVPQTEWDSHKAVISELYQNKTLAEMMTLMENSYGFYASKAQYIRQLKKWGVEKYSTNEKWKSAAQQVQKRKLEGKETEILINGTPVPWKKLKKEMARYGAAQAKVTEESETLVQLAGLSTGVVARTPPKEDIFTPSIKMTDMPWFRFQDLVDSLLPRFKNPAGFDPCDTLKFRDLGPVNDNYAGLCLPLPFHQEPLGSYCSNTTHQRMLPVQLLDQANRGARKLLGECLDESVDPDSGEYSSKILSSLREITIERHGKDPEQYVKELAATSREEALFQLLRYTAYLSSNNLLSDTKTDNLLKWITVNGKLQDLDPLLDARLPTAKIFSSNLLVSAVRLNKVNVVRALLMKGVDPNGLAGTDFKRTALSIAVEQECVSLVRILLDFKANPNDCDHSWYSYHSLLWKAISCGDSNMKVAKMLIAAGADVNAPVGNVYQGARHFAVKEGYYGYFQTPLQKAVDEDQTELAIVLLDAGANVNAFPAIDHFPWLELNHQREDGEHNADFHEDLGCPLQTSLAFAVRNKNLVMVRLLLFLGADVNEAGCLGTPLQIASRSQRNLVLIRLLLEKGADVNSPPPGLAGGMTALQEAAVIGEEDVVKCLLEAGADINAPPWRNGGRTVAQAAAELGHTDLIQLLVKTGANINASPAPVAGRTCLQAAAENHKVDMVQLLLQLGADVNSPPALEGGGKTVLQAAIPQVHKWYGRKLIMMLLEQGADINAPSSCQSGPSALCRVIQMNDYDLAHLLLARGANPDGDGGSFSPLGAAADLGAIDMVRSLLLAGANANRTHYGKTPLQIALKKGYFDLAHFFIDKTPASTDFSGFKALGTAIDHNLIEFVELLLLRGISPNEPSNFEGEPESLLVRTLRQRPINNDIVKALLSYGVDVNADNGRPLQEAAARGSVWAVQALLAAGADFNAPALLCGQKTALQSAVASSNTELVTLLLDVGADINAPPSHESGDTALQVAVNKESVSMVKLLLSRGADVNGPPSHSYGATALQRAAIKGHLRIALMLLQEGADINAAPAVVGGRTALEAAAEHGRLDLAYLFLRNDREPETLEARCKRAAELASSAGHDVIARIVREWKRENVD